MSYFSYVGKLFSNVKGFYNEINAATLTGAIDAIIIEQQDGSFRSSPFHVRFGKLGVLRSREKVVDIEINGEPVNIQMKLGESGEAFFVEQVDNDNEEIPVDLATSPLAYDSDFMEQGLKELHKEAERAEVKVQIKDDDQDTEVKVSSDSEVKVLPVGDTEVKVTSTDTTIAISDIVESVESSTGENKASDKSQEHIIHIEATKSDSAIKSEGPSEREITVRTENETKNEHWKTRKKRRRKRKNMPSTSSKIKSDTTNVNTGDAEDEIFEMEDISSDEEMSRLMAGMPKSISLPAVEESKLDRTNEWATAHESFYLNPHPFSDTDLSPLGSPINTRPHTPKSDTEVERQKSMQSQDALHYGEEETTLWDWGDLPRKSVTDETLSDQVRQVTPEEEKAAASGGLFQFMRKTKNVRHKPEEEGIYLDDLNIQDMDPETAKLYFPKRFSHHSHFHSIDEKEDDVESGRGASLPQSPHSVEGAIGGPSSTLLPSEIKHLGTYSLSLCGGLTDPDGVTLEKFMSKIVTYDDLRENPSMLTNPELVIRIGHKYYNWLTAAPVIISQIVFQKSLPQKTIEMLCTQHMPKKKEKKESYSWFSWRRKTTDGTTATSAGPPVLSESDVAASKSAETSPHDSMLDSQPSNPPSTTTSPQKIKPIDRLKGEDHSSSEADTDGSDRGGVSRGKKRAKRDVFKKSLRLSSEQIKHLNLQPGQNEVTYSVTTQFQGTKRCTSHIYLWKYNDKIIVSDIDGTITKSDVLGQILPIMGRDWSQSGVAQLYSSIYRNGYKFLYLSARAIGQSKLTKDLLRNINQGDMTLPEGPLLLSPTSLISAFHREVIEKKPEEFKISCLKDIGALFPQTTTPFYAGFGNKVNDVYAYKAISIPIFRIFTINPYGELKHELSYTFQSSYTKMMDVADHFFPPVHKLQQKQAGEYSQVEYWRDPLPEISPIEIEVVTGVASSTSASEKSSS